MREQGGGRIINVTNLGAKAPGAASVPTSVSRAAGVALTKAMSKEFAEDNILVNTVCIGLIKSGQHETRFKAMQETNPDLTLDQFYDDMGVRVPIWPCWRRRGSRRRNSLPGFRSRQLSDRNRRQHRRRHFPGRLTAHLSSLPECVIGKYEGHHRLDNRDGTRKHAWIVSSPTHQSRLIPVDVDRLLLSHYRSGRLEPCPHNDVLSVGNSTLDAAGIIRAGPNTPCLAVEWVVVLGAREVRAGKSRPDLETFARRQRQH